MDRISKALEIARQRRERVHGGHRHVRGAKFEYSQTRVMRAPPELLSDARIVGGNVTDGPLVDAYRLLRTRVIQRMEQNAWTTLGITSPGPQEGKTLTAINLAISIAMEGKYTVLLVDADLRRPALHRYFGIDPQFGLTDYLTSEIEVEKALINPGIDRLVLLPGRRPTAGASEHLSSPKMHKLVAEVRARYPHRLVIFDLPPVLIGDDVVHFSSQLNALLFVVREGKTAAEQLTKSLELMEGRDVVGTVLNCSDERVGSYHSYY